MTDEIHIDERHIQAIQGDPERTICLVVTPPENASESERCRAAGYVQHVLAGTRWEKIPIIVSAPGWTIQAVEMPASEAAKIESWRDREAML